MRMCGLKLAYTRVRTVTLTTRMLLSCLICLVSLLPCSRAAILSAVAQPADAIRTFRGPCVFNGSTSSHLQCDSNTVLLGGLFPIHNPPNALNASGASCGDRFESVGFQRMEAMRYAIDEINRRDMIPGVKLAFEMRDTCASPDFTRQQAVRFINRAIEDGNQCNAAITGQGISGVIGAAISGSSIAAADLLSLFRIPQISYASTSAALSDKDQYRYFIRTVPPDTFQAQAIGSLLDALKIRYFSLLYSTGSYGSAGAKEIRREINQRQAASQKSQTVSTCVAADQNIGANEKSHRGVYTNVLENLIDNVAKNASVCVAFTGAHSSVGFFQEASRFQRERHFTNHLWIASDAWANRDEALELDVLSVTRGTLGVTPSSNMLEAFDQHFLSLHPDKNPPGPTFNPWLNEFWKSVFKCDPDSAFPSERSACRQKTLVDTTNTDFSYTQNSKVAFVIDAVYAFAYALRQYQREKCGNGFRGICAQMMSDGRRRRQSINGEELLRYLLKLKFTSSAGHPTSFTEAGDLATAQYDITNLQVDPSTGRGYYTKVGHWERLPPGNHSISNINTNGYLVKTGCIDQTATDMTNCTLFRLQLNISAIQWHNGYHGSPSAPASQCSTPCLPGYSSSPLGHPFPARVKSCCWTCRRCPVNWYTANQMQPCQRCPIRQKSTSNRTGCVDLTADYWSLKHGEAIARMVLSLIGLLITIVTFVVVISIKHLLPSHSGLSFKAFSFCLVGMVGLCCTVFINLEKPTNASCAVEEIWISLSFGLLLGSLFLQFATATYLAQQSSRQCTPELPQTVESEPYQAEEKGKGVWDAITSHFSLSMFAILLLELGCLVIVMTMDMPKVHEYVDDNTYWEIGCQPSFVLGMGLAYCGVIAIATIVLRFYSLKQGLALHSSLKKVALLMPVVLLILVSGVVISSAISSSIQQATIICFATLTIALGSLFILIIPDLFKSLLQKTRSRSSETEHGHTVQPVTKTQQKGIFTRAASTLVEQSLFNKNVRSNEEERTRQAKTSPGSVSRSENCTADKISEIMDAVIVLG